MYVGPLCFLLLKEVGQRLGKTLAIELVLAGDKTAGSTSHSMSARVWNL